MAGYLDLHAIVLLQNGWRDHAVSLAAFRALFAADVTDGQIALAQVDEWFGLLVPAGDTHAVIFTPAYMAGHPKRLQVAVQKTDTANEQDFFGGFAGVPGQRAMVVNEMVTVRSHAPHPVVARALDACMVNLMLASIDALTAAGHQTMGYGGGNPPAPDLALLPDGVFALDQRWGSIGIVRSVTAATETPASWYLAAADITVNGSPGGVTAEVE